MRVWRAIRSSLLVLVLASTTMDRDWSDEDDDHGFRKTAWCWSPLPKNALRLVIRLTEPHPLKLVILSQCLSKSFFALSTSSLCSYYYCVYIYFIYILAPKFPNFFYSFTIVFLYAIKKIIIHVLVWMNVTNIIWLNFPFIHHLFFKVNYTFALCNLYYIHSIQTNLQNKHITIIRVQFFYKTRKNKKWKKHVLTIFCSDLRKKNVCWYSQIF